MLKCKNKAISKPIVAPKITWLIECAARYTREHITEITQNAVASIYTTYATPDILALSACTKSRKRLIIMVETRIDVALGHPYYPEHDVGMISLEY